MTGPRVIAGVVRARRPWRGWHMLTGLAPPVPGRRRAFTYPQYQPLGQDLRDLPGVARRVCEGRRAPPSLLPYGAVLAIVRTPAGGPACSQRLEDTHAGSATQPAWMLVARGD
jgi:hypothetical protein